jgi:hypothetical protein
VRTEEALARDCIKTRCPVCDALHREHSLMCEVEATVILQQRDDMILQPEQEGADRDKDQERQETVLFSRKRQAKIASRLQRHQTLAHSA